MLFALSGARKKGRPIDMNKKIGSGNEENGEEECVLYDRKCIGCGECELCDLDPLKICDNCGKCIDMKDVASLKIDRIEK